MTYKERLSPEKRPFESTELFDENMLMYYLNNLTECKANVARGLAILSNLEETDAQIYLAISLRCRKSITVNDRCYHSADQNFISLKDEYDKEKQTVHRESTILQSFLKRENRRIIILEGCIFSLPEPLRSIIIARYIDRESWPVIQKNLRRSASRVFALNKEGIDALHVAVKAYNALSACSPPGF